MWQVFSHNFWTPERLQELHLLQRVRRISGFRPTLQGSTTTYLGILVAQIAAVSWGWNEEWCKLILFVVLSSLQRGEVACLFVVALTGCYSERLGWMGNRWSRQAGIQCPKLFLIVSHAGTQRTRSATLRLLLRALARWRCTSFCKLIFAQDFLAVGLISLCMLNRGDACKHGAN